MVFDHKDLLRIGFSLYTTEPVVPRFSWVNLTLIEIVIYSCLVRIEGCPSLGLFLGR